MQAPKMSGSPSVESAVKPAGIKPIFYGVSGVGLRRWRRHPSEIGIGDALDFWRVLEM